MDHPNKHHQQIRLTKQISKSPLVLIRLFWIFTGIYQRHNSRATVMRADTASITTPAKPERNFAATTAIVPVTTAIAQSKKNENTFGNRKKRPNKMKIRLGIEKNVEKMKIRLGSEKKSGKTKKKNEKKTKKKTETNSRFFYVFWIFKNLLRGGPGTTKDERKRK